MRTPILHALLLISVIIVACAPQTAPAAYRNASVEELALLLESDEAFLLVNTHRPYEGHIAGTDEQWAFDDLPLGSLPQDKNAKIVLYCRSGRMSAIAAQTLADLQYTSVINIEGGMEAWRRSGREIVNATAPN